MPTEHTVEKTENKPALVPLLLWPGASQIFVPYAEFDDCAALIKGERGLMRDPASEVEIRRVLDLGANVGEFAIFCRLRWPYAWVDCVEADDERRVICATNVPAGTRMLLAADCLQPTRPPWSTYDLVRCTARYDFVPEDDTRTRLVFFDGVKRTLPEPWELLATGMRAKNSPWSWWRRP